MVERLSGETRLFPIIGDPIIYVQSPERLTSGFAARGHNGICVPMQVPEGDLESVMHGLTLIPNIDDMLDGLAFVKAQKNQGAQPEGARVLLVGAGSAIAITLLESGVRELIIHDTNEARLAIPRGQHGGAAHQPNCPLVAMGTHRALCSGKVNTDANESSPSHHHRVRTPRAERSTRLSLSCLTSLRNAQAPAPRLYCAYWFCRTVWFLGHHPTIGAQHVHDCQTPTKKPRCNSTASSGAA